MVFNNNAKAIRAQTEEQEYKEQRKKEALQRVQLEIEEQRIRQKALLERRQKMKVDKEREEELR